MLGANVSKIRFHSIISGIKGSVKVIATKPTHPKKVLAVKSEPSFGAEATMVKAETAHVGGKKIIYILLS